MIWNLCSNPNYHHEVVIILVSHAVAVAVETMHKNTNRLPTLQRRPMTVRIPPEVHLYMFEVGEKER
jgi:hypothetical protein